MISVRKALLLLLLSWCASLLLCLPPPVLRSPPVGPRPALGACFPSFAVSGWYYPAVYSAVGFLLPVAFVLAVNLKIVRIAKYHQFRYAVLSPPFPHALNI